jgi:hypothetical protein
VFCTNVVIQEGVGGSNLPPGTIKSKNINNISKIDTCRYRESVPAHLLQKPYANTYRTTVSSVSEKSEYDTFIKNINTET